MTLQNLHEMIRNLSSYIKSLELLCESGVRLSKNFERLLTPSSNVPPGPPGQQPGQQSQQQQQQASATGIDSEILAQSVSNWEIIRSRVEQDSNSLISELLPLLQEAVTNVMKDQSNYNSTNTFEVFRSSFAAFFQIQWRFCSLYLQCASVGSYPPYSGGGYPRTPTEHHGGLARSPTQSSFNSSSGGDRRESTESCFSNFSSFSMHRSSISGLSSLSSRSSSPSPQFPHGLGYYGYHRSRNSSLVDTTSLNPSVKFTPSQPPSPLYPYPTTEGGGGVGSSFLNMSNMFRRWSTHTPNFSNPGGSGTGSSLSPSNSSNISAAVASYATSSSNHAGSISIASSSNSGGGPTGTGNIGGNFHPIGSRRWSVPASAHNISTHSASSKKSTEQSSYDIGLVDAINLLSVNIQNPSTILESSNEFRPIIEQSHHGQSTICWPPSDGLPGVVLTSCISGPDQQQLQQQQQHQQQQMQQQSIGENLLYSSQQQTLRVPFGSSPDNNSTTNTNSSATSSSTINTSTSSILQSNQQQQQQQPSISPPLQNIGEYSLFGNSPSPTQAQ